MSLNDVPDSNSRSLVIGVTAVSSVMGGGITVVQNLTRSMAEERPDYKFVLYCSHESVATFDYPSNVEVVHLPKLLSRLSRWAWEQRELPSDAEARGIDVILALGGYLSFRAKAPQVAVWQNSVVFSPGEFSRPFAERVLIVIQRVVQTASMKRAARNVFLTQTSVELAGEQWDMESLRHAVIHSGVDPTRLSLQASPPLEDREGFVLAVGHAYSHKNYEAMIDAIGIYRTEYGEELRLRIVGDPANQDYFDGLQRRILDQGLSDLVEMSGGAPAEEVLSLMSRARAYLVTSQLETFGLTMFEAMGQGLPVVASNATCHPEVCGDAAVYCDPNDPADIAAQVRRVMTDTALGNDLRARGFERLNEFSWAHSARKYLATLAGSSQRRK
jgi:glycosyltransferase involved in cell wall biosynthesis